VKGALVGLALATALLGGCRSTRSYLPNPSPYDLLDDAAADELAEVRREVDAGRPEVARDLLAGLNARFPRSIVIGRMLQDVELELLARGHDVRGIEGSADGGEVALSRAYRRRAEEVPTSEAWVLAARLAAGPEARGMLARAIELDPANPWAHYGLAWLHASSGEAEEARASIERAFAIDGGHLPSVRLDAYLFHAGGELRRANRALEVWLERAAEDPSVPTGRLDEARVDLAILAAADGSASRALDLLDEVVHPDARALLARAAAHAARDELDEALAAVVAAREEGPDDLLTLAQEAQLAARVGEPARELELWRRVLDTSSSRQAPLLPAGEEELSPLDFRALLIQLQAHTRLERLVAEHGEPAP